MAHEYKVGDLVRILPREGCSGDYMYSFTESMLPFVGQVCKITRISRNDHNGSSHKKLDDGHMYLLEGNSFTWASSMFEPYDEKKITSPKFKEGDIVEVLPREGESSDYSHAYVSDMLQYAGKRATIVYVRRDTSSRIMGRRGDDGYCYILDVDKGDWNWSSSALKAVSPREPDKKDMASTEATPIKSDQERPECPYSLIRESQENYNLNFNM